MNTQHVCETHPACECTGGDDPYSCDCTADEATGACVHCGELMVVIDADTGDVVRGGVCH